MAGVPVDVLTLPASRGRLVYVPPVSIPGIVAADALDANDAMGTVFAVKVPNAGAIVQAFFHDLDDEGSNKTLHLFQRLIGGVANDAAWTLSDDEALAYCGTIVFDTKIDGGNAQIVLPASTALPLWYIAPTGFLYCQVQTAGTDNIAAGSMPAVSFVIHEYRDGAVG